MIIILLFINLSFILIYYFNWLIASILLVIDFSFF